MSAKKITSGQMIIATAGIALFAVLFINSDAHTTAKSAENSNIAAVEKTIVSSEGTVLPIKWNDLGKRMVEAGVIDKDKFEAIYARRGGLTEDDIRLLYGENNEGLVMNAENSGILLNLLWAFGLSNKNKILEEGPMVSEKYGGDAGKFASTGGWSISIGDPMDHYSNYSFVTLSKEQQKLVERVSKNIYRPCCGNSTYFPDCNHGMAMLGLLELLASGGVNESEMYDIALKVNSYWFPDTYLTIAEYFNQRGVSWVDVDSKKVLSAAYSSARGYMKILEEMEPVKARGGTECGI